MIEKYDFVIFLSEDWLTFFRRHLIRAVAGRISQSKVLCVERPVCPLITPLKNPDKFVKWVTGQGNLWKEKENLSIFRPFVFLHDHVAARLPVFPWINRKLLGWQMDRAIETLGLRKNHLIAWILDPIQEECLGLLNEQLTIYECCDEYTAYPTVPLFRTPDDVSEREIRILSQADVVFVVSESLHQRKSKFNKNVHIVPNAGDTQHFMQATNEGTRIADDVAEVPPPIIGFLGNLTGRIDFALLEHLAREHPEWSIVIVGGVTELLKKTPYRQVLLSLGKMGNVHFLSAKPYDSLPSYLKAFNVCLIPYTPDDPFNINCSPLKLYEYLATGKPIVSTDLPGVRAVGDIVRIGRDYFEFEQEVATALEEKDEQLKQGRLEVAKENSWERRAEQVVTLLERYL